MTLAEMADHVVSRVGVDDDTTLDLAKSFLKRRYVTTFNKYPWMDAHMTFTLRTTSNEIILPNWVDKVVQIRVDNASDARNLQMVSRQTVMLVAPGALDDEGSRVAFSPLPSIATHTHPGGNQVTVQSSDSSDTTQEVRIRGMHNGLEFEESLMLVGVTPVTSSGYYDEITHFSKPTTVGSVTLKSTDTNTPELQILLPQERERRHPRIQLHYDYATGADEEVITVLNKRRCVPLRHDNDTPHIPNLEDALIAFAMADLLERERQFAKASVKVQEAVALVNETLLAERDQQQNHVQIIPEVYDYAEQRTLY